MNLQNKRKQVEDAKVEMRSAERQLESRTKKLKEVYGISTAKEINKREKQLEKKLRKLESKREEVEAELDELLEEIG